MSTTTEQHEANKQDSELNIKVKMDKAMTQERSFNGNAVVWSGW